MPGDALRPRFVAPRLVEVQADTPVVLSRGPRQCGKTTPTQAVGKAREWAYFSFDPEPLTGNVEMQQALRDHPRLRWKALNVRGHRGLAGGGDEADPA
jgi:hypothetical protein